MPPNAATPTRAVTPVTKPTAPPSWTGSRAKSPAVEGKQRGSGKAPSAIEKGADDASLLNGQRRPVWLQDLSVGDYVEVGEMTGRGANEVVFAITLAVTQPPSLLPLH